jgi:hypothetical protein
MEYIEFFLGFGLGWFIASRITTALHLTSFGKILKELGVSNQQLRKLRDTADLELDDAVDEPETVCEIKIEQHGDQLYAYRKEDDHFLGQGTDRDSLIARISKEFSGQVRLIIREEDGAEHIKQIG